VWADSKDLIKRFTGVKEIADELKYLEERLGRVYDSKDTKKAAKKTGGEVYYNLTINQARALDIDWDSDDHSSLKEQLKNHLDEVNKMQPVATVVYNKQSKKTYYKILEELLKEKFGNKIERQEYGTITFGQSTIDGSRNYVNNDAEAAAIISAPYVLKRGKAITGHKNHKGKGNVSITFAAPVILNGKRGNVVVCVLYGKGQVHSLRVLTTDGGNFELLKIKDIESTITGHKTKNVGKPYIESMSNDSILENNPTVKDNISTESENYSDISEEGLEVDAKTPTTEYDISFFGDDLNRYSGSKGSENLYNTPEYLMPDTEREWSAFNRSFANQTNDLKKGQKKDIIINTAESQYLITADGYMSGTVVSKISIEDFITTEREVNEYSRTKTFDSTNDRQRDRRKNDGSIGVTLANGKRVSVFTNLDSGKTTNSEPRGSFDKSDRNNKESVKIKNNETFSSDNLDTDNQYSNDDITLEQKDLLERYNNGELTQEEYLANSSQLWIKAKEQYGSFKEGENAKNAIAVPQAVSDDLNHLANPIVITEYIQDNTVNVYGMLYYHNTPVVVGVVATKGRGGNVITKIRTVHARGNFVSQITDDTILYLNENKKETNK